MQRPSVTLVQSYIAKFDSCKYNRSADEAVTAIFTAFPLNYAFDEVLAKVSILHTWFRPGTRSNQELIVIADRIVSLDIDRELVCASTDAISKLRDTTRDATGRALYSFATKYCSWHRPNVYPMYDSNVEKALCHYQQTTPQFAVFIPGDLKKYVKFQSIIDQFRTAFELNEFCYRALDKFLWLCGQELP